MATLTPTLTLVSTDAFTHQPIKLSVTDSLSVVAPYTDISRVAAATGGTLIIAQAASPITYVYIKHTGLLAADGNETTNLVTVRDEDDASIATLAAGEFCFFPLAAGIGLEVATATAAAFVEYIYFSKA
jgi:hypothetical protein